jgi:hypothetical protein
VSAIDSYVADLAFEHDLSLPLARKLASLAIYALDDTHDPEAPAALADPDVAWTYVQGPLGIYTDDSSADQLERFASDVIDKGFDTAGAWFARGCVAERRGDLAAAQRHYAASLERDGSFWPAVRSQAFLAFVRGEVTACRRFLRDDSYDGPMLDLLDRVDHLRPERNAPCACGSGRKTKVCCGEASVPPVFEAGWLWDKAALWLRRLPQAARFVEAACRIADLDRDAGDRLVHAVTVPVSGSLALFEHGLIERFAADFGPLLRETEQATLASWRGVTHRIWEVRDTEPGHTLTLVDLASGAEVRAQNGSVSLYTRPGELVYAAVLPSRDGRWLLPCQPLCLDDDVADVYADLLEHGVDPLLVAKGLLAGEYDATM